MTAAWKLAALALGAAGLVLIGDVRVSIAAFALACGVAWTAGVGFRSLFAGWRGALILVLLTGGARWAVDGADPALAVAARLAALLAAARVFTLTTTATELLDAFRSLFRPFERLGLDTENWALAFSLVLRLIPLLEETMIEIRDAQRARGLDRHPLALLSPLLARASAIGDDVADALDARSGGPRSETPET